MVFGFVEVGYCGENLCTFHLYIHTKNTYNIIALQIVPLLTLELLKYCNPLRMRFVNVEVVGERGQGTETVCLYLGRNAQCQAWDWQISL